ncbi:MAG: c-type cytochrome biogenesis protein CcmI [Proteobacteria bacterium]|nr:c-type cytochrome biogenesis protein CcmI [Pseudomonadota bacterium]MCL2307331.1 c-type cytochrome biogenesis protein CcmI [Pseudomonadota bacterium]
MISFAVYLFAGVAVLMVVLALAWIGPRLFSAPGVRAGLDRETTNLEIYRDELAQLTVDYQCGRLSPEALEEARAELSRRLLDDTGDHEPNVNRMCMPTRAVGVVVMLLVPLLAGGLYLNVGSVGALHAVAGGEQTEQNFYQQLQDHVKRYPSDARAWIILGRHEMSTDRFQEAIKAFESGMAASPKVANDATVLCELAEAIGMAQGGTLKGRPRELVEKALAVAPDNALALELAGGAAYEEQDYATAAMHWNALLAQIPENSQAYQQLRFAIARVEMEAMRAQQEGELLALP